MADKNQKKVPTLFIEVYDRRDSGFIRDDTQGTPFEEKLNCPSKLVVPNVGFRKRTDGKPGIEEIRYISGVDEISVQKQREMGLEPNSNKSTDKLVIENGAMTIVEEGSEVGKFRYLNEVFYNASVEGRSEKASALFKSIDLNSIEETRNENEDAEHEAVGFIYSLREKRGDGYIYQEERINAICELFTVSAERMASKVGALVGLARLKPKFFLDKVKKLEQTAATMVAHALQLNVIKFEGNTALYLIKDKVLKNLGAGVMKQDEKITELSLWLRTSDGRDAYTELTAEVDSAKSKK